VKSKCKAGLSVLVATLALGAVGVTSASAALPEFNNRTSSTEKFSGPGEVTLEYGGGNMYGCTSATASGEIEPGKTKTIKNVVIAFKRCTGGFCNSPETTTKPLTGTLGYLDTATKEVGLLLKPSSGSVVECTAALTKGSIIGSVILKVSPIGKETPFLVLSAQQSKGHQQFTHFEGESETHNLEFEYFEHKFANELIGLGGLFEIESAHNVEIEA
jgi:hypothetical protein